MEILQFKPTLCFLFSPIMLSLRCPWIVRYAAFHKSMINLPVTSFLMKISLTLSAYIECWKLVTLRRNSCRSPISVQRFGLYWACTGLMYVATITVSSLVHLSFCVLWTLFPWIQQSWVNGFSFWICWPVRSHQLLKKISGSSQYCWLYPRAQEKDVFAKVTLRLVTEHGNFRTVLAWKCQPFRLPFSTRNYLGGEKCSTILSSCEPCEISTIWTSKTISSIQS